MDPLTYILFQLVLHARVTMVMICAILSVDDAYKITLAANQKE